MFKVVGTYLLLIAFCFGSYQVRGAGRAEACEEGGQEGHQEDQE